MFTFLQGWVSLRLSVLSLYLLHVNSMSVPLLRFKNMLPNKEYDWLWPFCHICPILKLESVSLQQRNGQKSVHPLTTHTLEPWHPFNICQLNELQMEFKKINTKALSPIVYQSFTCPAISWSIQEFHTKLNISLLICKPFPSFSTQKLRKRQLGRQHWCIHMWRFCL